MTDADADGGFDVREATEADALDVGHVAPESWHAAYTDLLGPDAVDSTADEWCDSEGLTRSMDRDDGVFLAGERGSGDGVVGFAQGVLGFGDEADAAELPRIYVHPDDRGAGSDPTSSAESKHEPATTARNG